MPYTGSKKHTFTVCFVPDFATYHIEWYCARVSMIDASAWPINAFAWCSGATLTHERKLSSLALSLVGIVAHSELDISSIVPSLLCYDFCKTFDKCI